MEMHHLLRHEHNGDIFLCIPMCESGAKGPYRDIVLQDIENVANGYVHKQKRKNETRETPPARRVSALRI